MCNWCGLPLWVKTGRDTVEPIRPLYCPMCGEKYCDEEDGDEE